MSYVALEKLLFEAPADGERLLLTGAVHGNEDCGPKALRRIVDDIHAGRITLRRGSVAMIPECNPEALRLGQRFVNADLNRDMTPKAHPVTYEDHLANQICEEIDAADILLDVHSNEAGGAPFVFLGEPDEREFELAQIIGSHFFIHSWQKSYDRGMADAGITIPAHHKGKTPVSLSSRARAQGKPGITAECGKNGSTEAEENAYNAILNALEHVNGAEISPQIKRQPRVAAQKIIELKTVFFKAADNQMARRFENFEPLKKGDLVATFNNGKTLRAPEDGYAVLPYKAPPPGEKILIFGVEQTKADFFKSVTTRKRKKPAPGAR